MSSATYPYHFADFAFYETMYFRCPWFWWVSPIRQMYKLLTFVENIHALWKNHINKLLLYKNEKQNKNCDFSVLQMHRVQQLSLSYIYGQRYIVNLRVYMKDITWILIINFIMVKQLFSWNWTSSNRKFNVVCRPVFFLKQVVSKAKTKMCLPSEVNIMFL